MSTYASTDVNYGLRLRNEQLNPQNGPTVEATTLKLRADAKHQINHSLSAFFQLDHVQPLFNKVPNDGVTNAGGPAIVDPKGTEVNQFHLTYQLEDINFLLGRQSITHGEQRFIGDLGFRQNDQTYDGLRVQTRFAENVSIDYSYITQVNRIFGDDAGRTLSRADIRHNNLSGQRPAVQYGDHKIEGHILHSEFSYFEYISLSTTAIAVHNVDVAAFSNRSLHLKADFKRKHKRVRWFGSLAYAWQKKQQSQNKMGIDYWQTELGAKIGQWQISGRYEYFGENGDEAFITPLATLHKFQGWTDQFINTPRQGLIDQSLRLFWRKRPYSIDIRYHDFKSVKGSTTIGDELNADFVFKVKRKHELKLRYAVFNAGLKQTIRPNDIRKTFLMYSYNL